MKVADALRILRKADESFEEACDLNLPDYRMKEIALNAAEQLFIEAIEQALEERRK